MIPDNIKAKLFPLRLLFVLLTIFAVPGVIVGISFQAFADHSEGFTAAGVMILLGVAVVLALCCTAYFLYKTIYLRKGE